MPELLAKHLRGWLDKHHTPNEDGYLFINKRSWRAKKEGKPLPYRSEDVVRAIHRATTKLGIKVPRGTHLGMHCFRHGVTSEMLEAGTPIHVVTKHMRHGDSKVTLKHYAHIIGDAERVASERLSQKIEAQLESDSKWSQISERTA